MVSNPRESNGRSLTPRRLLRNQVRKQPNVAASFELSDVPSSAGSVRSSEDERIRAAGRKETPQRLSSRRAYGGRRRDGPITAYVADLSIDDARLTRSITTSKFRDKRRANRLAMTITIRRRRALPEHRLLKPRRARRRLETPWVGIHVSSTREYRDFAMRFQCAELGHSPEMFGSIKAARRKPSGSESLPAFGTRRVYTGGLAPFRFEKDSANAPTSSSARPAPRSSVPETPAVPDSPARGAV